MSRNPDFDAVMIKKTELEQMEAEIERLVASLHEASRASVETQDLMQAEIERLHKIELQFDALKEERVRWRADNEMLSEDNDRLRTQCGGNCRYWEGRYRDEAREIARLRAALESLTKDPVATLDEPDPDWEVIVKMRAIARAALERKP